MRYIREHRCLFAQRNQSVITVHFLYRADDIDGGDLAMLTDMGVAKISGFIAEDFVGVRINQRVAAPENLPLIPLVLGDALDEGAIAGAQRDATFRSGDDACRTVELVGADHQRFGQERFDH